jgi:hypothetical protein
MRATCPAHLILLDLICSIEKLFTDGFIWEFMSKDLSRIYK